MTKARKEQLANQHLRRQGYETFFPHYKHWTTPKKTKPREVIKPYLTRYIFVGMDRRAGHSFYNINSTIGVSTVVYCGYQALSIPPSIIQELKERANNEGEVYLGKKPEPPFPGKVGDKIKLAEHSPLFGLIAELRGVDKSGKLVVKLEQMLGAEREILISRTDVGAIISREDGASRPLEPTTGENAISRE